MCGITGFLGMKNDVLIKTMTRILAHRGPDNEGVFSDENISLGHRRLSIIDLSSLGHQPMIDANGQAIISYNGEIYNYKEIKQELINLGYRFNSKTDTEVVLNAYLAWGEGCLSRFNGMFAFAIWNKKDRTLFLARDRIGIKPLYYMIKNQVIIFASEIKSILCWSELRREVNGRALDYFFTFRYNHLEETLFKNIRKLLPAHYMKVQETGNGRLIYEIKRYWDVSTSPANLNVEQVENELSDNLKRSVDYRMISDVPVGSLLSSGIDSSLIVGIVKNVLKKPAHTFTVGFDYPGFVDELDTVRFTTKFFETNHTEYICKPNINSVLSSVIWSTDELNADPTLIPTYLISQIASKDVKVVLSGEGGDELFGGYQRTMFMKYVWNMSQYSSLLTNSIPFIVNRIPSFVLNKMFKYSSAIGQKGRDRLSSFCKNIQNIGASYLEVISIFNHNDKKDLYGSKLRYRLKEENIADTINKQYFNSKIDNSDELFNRILYFDLVTRLPNDLLAKVDTMTMAHSLEARVPYLDHRLVEMAFSMPANFKLRMMREKYILRKAAARYLPRQIINRKKDHFFVPIHLWLQNELQPIISKILTKKNIEKNGYLDSRWVINAYNNYKKGELFYARQIWNVISFLIWHKLYIESDQFKSMKSNPLSIGNLFSDN